jgi:hypothetical protein
MVGKATSRVFVVQQIIKAQWTDPSLPLLPLSRKRGRVKVDLCLRVEVKASTSTQIVVQGYAAS